MTLLEVFQTYTGITDPFVSQIFTGVVFVVGIALVVSILVKSLFRI